MFMEQMYYKDENIEDMDRKCKNRRKNQKKKNKQIIDEETTAN